FPLVLSLSTFISSSVTVMSSSLSSQRSSSCFLRGNSLTVLYSLALHDALPIFWCRRAWCAHQQVFSLLVHRESGNLAQVLHEITDRKSTRLNSSHVKISYAVFCLKKKNHPHSPFTQSL